MTSWNVIKGFFFTFLNFRFLFVYFNIPGKFKSGKYLNGEKLAYESLENCCKRLLKTHLRWYPGKWHFFSKTGLNGENYFTNTSLWLKYWDQYLKKLIFSKFSLIMHKKGPKNRQKLHVFQQEYGRNRKLEFIETFYIWSS